MYAVATFLSPLQSNDLSEPEKKIARDHLKAEVQKLEDYMGEEAIETNDKIRVWRTTRRSTFLGLVT